jgi:hypothetical protein
MNKSTYYASSQDAKGDQPVYVAYITEQSLIAPPRNESAFSWLGTKGEEKQYVDATTEIANTS